MVIAFSPVGTLVEAHAAPAPRACVSKTLAELERLKVIQLMAADLPRDVLEGIAQTIRFSGSIISDSDPFSAARASTPFPPACFWWVTAQEREAERAQREGCNGVLIDDRRVRAIDERYEGDPFIIPDVEDVLRIIRQPYTQAALAVRRVLWDLGSSSRGSGA